MTNEHAHSEAEAEVGIDAERSLIDQGVAPDALHRLVSRISSEFAVEIPLDAFMQEPTLRRLGALVGDGSAAAAAAAVQRASASSRRDGTLAWLPELQRLTEEMLDHGIEVDTDLFQQGMTSLVALQLLQTLRRTHDVAVGIERFLERPTLRHLAALTAQARAEDAGTTTGHARTDAAQPTRLTTIPAAAAATSPATLVHAAAVATPEAIVADDARWQRLQELGHDCLGYVPTPDADLFQEGMTSLGVLTLVQAARNAFGTEIAVEPLLQRPTLRRLAMLLDIAPPAGAAPAAVAADVAIDVVAYKAAAPVGADAATSAPTSTDAFAQLSMLSPKADKEAFLRRGFNLRANAGTAPFVAGPAIDTADFLVAYARHRSRRRFADGAIERQALFAWLSAVAAREHDDEATADAAAGHATRDVKPRYLYPSAGGTYSVQLYLEIKPGGVAGLDPGLYYYHPLRHGLTPVGESGVPAEAHFFYNRDLYAHSAVCLYFVAEHAGIAPIYHEHAAFFAAVETGAMIQRLIETQSAHGIAGCVLSGTDPDHLRASLALGPSQQPLLAMACGCSGADAAGSRPSLRTTFAAADPAHPSVQPSPQLSQQTAAALDVAIVAIAGRFPQAETLEAYWDNLRAGRCCLSPPPAQRWQTDAEHRDIAGYLHDSVALDHVRLGLSATEAAELGDDERALLGCVAALLDDGTGTCAQHLPARTGVYVGAMWNDRQIDAVADGRPRAPLSVLSNRISQCFDWSGPSLAIDTSCSSALAAICLAAEGVARGDCEAAVAGGVNLLGHREHLANLRRLHLLSDADSSDTFGDRASGWIAGEGVGMVLLKRRDRAEVDGDRVLGVILSGALGAAGRVARFGMPAIERQIATMREALRRAQVDTDGVDYVECAAAGSAMGDAAEFSALQQVFEQRRTPLWIGSVKPNIGHLESASGISQLAKVLLQMRHGMIAPTLRRGGLNPLIDPTRGMVRIATDALPWPDPADRAAVALIHSVGGTGSSAALLIASPAVAGTGHRAATQQNDAIGDGGNGAATSGTIVRDDNGAPKSADDEQTENSSGASRHRTVLDRLLRECAELRGELFGAEAAGLSLFALGLSSADIVALVARLDAALGIKPTPALLLSAPTLDDLAAALAANTATAGVTQPSTGTVVPHADTRVREVRGETSLSEGQSGLWVLQKIYPQSFAYNCPIALRIEGRIDHDALTRALGALARRHPVLGAYVREDDGRPLLCWDATRTLSLSVETLTGAGDAEAAACARALARVPFRIDVEPLCRVHLLDRGEDGVVLFVIHHLVFDGRSSLPLLRDFLRSLAVARAGRDVDAGTGEVSAVFAAQQFVAEEFVLLNGAEGARRLDYWRERLAAPLPTLSLPTDFPRAAAATDGATWVAALGDDDLRAVHDYCREHRVYPSAVLMSAYLGLLHQYSGQDDLIVGMPVDVRPQALRTEIGYFVRMAPIRSATSATMPAAAFIAGVQQTMFDGIGMAYPLPVLARALKIVSEAEVAPIFQVAFAYQNYADESELAEALGEDCVAVPLTGVAQEGEFELQLEVIDRGAGVELHWKYDPALWRADTIARMHAHWVNLLRSFLVAPDLYIEAHSMLSPAERRTLIETWNDTAYPYQHGLTIHGLFERQVVRTPEAVAASDAHESLSYARLDAEADALARVLVAHGVGSDVPVGICLDRSVAMIVALLATLKAGGAYVPIDPDYPQARTAFMLEDIEAPVLITQRTYRERFTDVPGAVLEIDAWRETPIQTRAPGRVALPAIAADGLAYIIYTSGSTGRPKGCMLPHRAVVNRLLWMQDTYHLNAGDVVLQKTPYSFDVSVWEFFWPLLAGARLVFAAPGGHKDPAYLIRLIESEAVTTCHFVPSMLGAFLSVLPPGRCRTLRRVFASGEALPHPVCEQFQALLEAELHNLYGPTEAAVDVTYWQYRGRDDRKVPIGRPIHNIRMYVLRDDGQPAPIGVPGELFIGGVGLARGYLKREELTVERFVPDPFSDRPDARLYRTGDLARWLAEGTIEYLGRIDQQVKIRGFRIELGEIEAALLAHPDVREAAVVAFADRTGEKRLAAYAAPVVGVAIRQAQIREFIGRSLPEHMIPAFVVAVDVLPLTQSGKLDRKALPDPLQSLMSSSDYVAPQTADEVEIARLWRELLGVERIGRHDSFFELGGHSLSAVTLLSRVAKAFDGIEIAQIDFYRDPTIAGLGERVRGDVASPRDRVPVLYRAPSEAATTTLICVPYAGASATVYQPLAAAIARMQPGFTVRAVALPGNEFGDTESATARNADGIEALADDLAGRIANDVSGELIVYGHCVGSFLALELTRRLEARGRAPRMLVAGAAFPLPRIVRYLPLDDPWRFTGDSALHRKILAWGGRADATDPDVIAFMLRNFRKDARMAFQYERRRRRWKIGVPILNIVSRDDPLTEGFERRHRAWSELGETATLATIERGGHYFVGREPDAVASILVGAYRKLASPPAAGIE